MRTRLLAIRLFSLSIALLAVYFPFAGRFLIINEPPRTSDVLIVLSGGNIGRFDRAIELYHEGFAPYIILSNGLEDNLYEYLKSRDIPSEAIILENEAASTADSAFLTKQLAVHHAFHSAIIVSSSTHMRRVKINFDSAFRSTHIQLTYCSANDSHYNPNLWWVKTDDRNTTISEYMKLAGNVLGIHGKHAKEQLNHFMDLISSSYTLAIAFHRLNR